MKVMLTSLAGDTPWMAKLLLTAGSTAKNSCHNCHVPTQRVDIVGTGGSKQSYTGYNTGFKLDESMLDLINKTKEQVRVGFVRNLPFESL